MPANFSDVLPDFLERLQDESQRNKKSVIVPAERWQLFKEYDILSSIERIFNVHIQASETPSKEVQLTLHGWNAAKATRMLDVPPLKLDVPEEVNYWLTTKGPKGTRVFEIENKLGALVQKSRDYKSVLLVGTPEATLAVKRIIEGLHIKHRLIPPAVHYWLTNKAEGAERAREMDLESKFDTCVCLRAPSDDDPDCMLDLTVVGVREENVDDVLAIIAESDACIVMVPLGDVDDPSCMVDLAVVGECEANVDQVLADIAGLVVEKVTVKRLQFEFWYGHDGEDQQQRPHHKLEDDTNTYILRDDGASCMHVAGRPENVKEAVERIRKSQHIKLIKEQVTMAVGNYVAGIRPDLENDDLQIHLRYVDMRPGTCELRRLHRIDSEEDDPKQADQKLMREIDLHEVVLDVHESWEHFLRGQCRQIEASEGVGIDVSAAVDGRVLVTTAGSRTTVKRGTQAVIELLVSERPHRAGDIRLRRIRGQSVDTAGFEKAAPVGEQDLSNCEHSFHWERLTRELWRYTGRHSPERKRKRSTKPKQSKAEKNADANRG